MGKMGEHHGSERHLLTYRQLQPAALDEAIRQATGLTGPMQWIYPTTAKAREPKGVNFLTDRPDVVAAWKKFWPQTGNQQRWDGIARCGDEWLLIEAKANHPEFCTPPCGAKADGRKKIQKALGEVKAALGVHRHFTWLGSYYQYANRLAILYFLAKEIDPPVAARLVFVHFLGDQFPDARPCPATEGEWLSLIEARRLTLGLPHCHAVSGRVHEVFLPALQMVGV
jgi:hypothetical protein